MSDTKFDDLQSLRIDRSAIRNRPPRHRARTIALAVVAVLVLLMVVRALMPKVTTVEVTQVAPLSSQAADVVLTASGYIVPHHKINVNSKVTGRVAWIGVEKGDHVKQGQVLVRLEDQEFRAQVEQARGQVENARAYLTELRRGSRPQEIQQALANLRQAEATLANDRIILQRTQSLAGQGIFSKEQLDNAQATFNTDQERVNALRQAWQLAKIGPRPEEITRAEGQFTQAQGQLAYAQSLLDATVIRAPVNGTILERTAEKGELITAQFASAADTGGPQGSVVALADLNDLQVELDIAQNDFARLQPRQPATLSTDAYPDRVYHGYIDQISPEADRQKATVQVKVRILNPDAYLRPEMNANVKFLAVRDNDAPPPKGVLVPLEAIHVRDGQSYVFVLQNDRAVERQVHFTAQRANGSLTDDLPAGSRVIVKSANTLQSGDRVKVGTVAGA